MHASLCNIINCRTLAGYCAALHMGISGHVLNRFLGHEDNVVIDACSESKCFLPLTRFYSNVHVHTLAGAHIHAHSLIKARRYTLSLFSVFSMADSVPKVHLQG